MKKLCLLLLPLITLAREPRVEVSEPVLVVEGPASEHRWGRYQFPTLYRMADGGLVIFVHVEADAVDSYGKPGKAFVSRDKGATWTPDEQAAERAYGLRLPNGDYLQTATTPAVPVKPADLPKPVGKGNAYKDDYDFYRLSELPEPLRLIVFNRFAAGGSRWERESTPLDHPDGLRAVVRSMLPRIWWGDIRIAADGSLLAVTYPAYYEQTGKLYSQAICHRSTDQGKTWRFQGRIEYLPDTKADPRGVERTGFTEPAFEILKDGSLLAVLRTTDGLGVGPMYYARSRDQGRHWTPVKPFTPTGVLPRLLRLDNGVLVLSSGRPGVDLRFSFDGRGRKWTEPRRLVPVVPPNVQADSCGYTDLVALDANTFLIVYSWFQRPGADGLPHKSILVRQVKVDYSTSKSVRRRT